MTKVYKNLNKAGENPRHSNKDPPPGPTPLSASIYILARAQQMGGGGVILNFSGFELSRRKTKFLMSL